MRRAAVQVLRSARRPLRAAHEKNRLLARRERDRGLQIIPSSMYFRNFSVALVSTLVASGAYLFYREGPTLKELRPGGREYLDSAGSFTGAAQQAIEATKKALVIDQGQIFTGTVPADDPIAKDTEGNGRRVLEMVTPEQATQQIRGNEESYKVARGKGVVRYDVSTLPSNDPIEDDHAEKIIEVPQSVMPASDATNPTQQSQNSDWMFWGVFDGHSGWTTSAKLRQTLIAYVARELNTTYASAAKSATSILPTSSPPSSSPFPDPSSVDAAIKRGFMALDSSIVDQSVSQVLAAKSKPMAAQLLAPALAGSCALLSFYDSASKTLRVACTGDSRAILGRRNPSDPAKWRAVPLSVDQTGANEDEAARLRSEHPNEPNVVRAGRVLGGLEPTRAFGDASYKWSTDIQDVLKREYFGRTANPLIKTPPYVTAEPVISTTRIQPESGDFVVMATDGLWEMLSNEEVVGLVGQWLEKNPGAGGRGRSHRSDDSRASSWLKSFFGGGSGQLPVKDDQLTASDRSGQRTPIRQRQWGIKEEEAKGTATSSRFVVEDKNAATHLVRNALGGRDKDMVCALLTLPSPYSRRYRDDLTVEVIFFGDGTGEEVKGPRPKDSDVGRVVVNEEAHRKGNVSDDDVKARAKL